MVTVRADLAMAAALGGVETIPNRDLQLFMGVIHEPGSRLTTTACPGSVASIRT
jgi:hypothetical protein